VHWSMSGEVLLMALIGGIGTLTGPVVGAFLVTGLGDYLATTGHWVTVLQGVIFVICVLAFRRGIVGGLEDFARSFPRKTSTRPRVPAKAGPQS
jgi:branched-chain amino acid transport system permease protein